jgi:hypothetical protein
MSQWLSLPDPFTNHNIACKANHGGTAQWFPREAIFNKWKPTGSFLWIHRKRALVRPSSTLFLWETDVGSSIVQDIKALRDAAKDGVDKTRSSAIWTSGSPRKLDEENRHKRKL